MIQKIIIMLIMVTSIFSISEAQRLWELSASKNDFNAVQRDTSVDHLRDYISRKHLRRDAAARILALNRGGIERDFILDNYKISAIGHNINEVWEGQYYWYQFFRGYFGDSGAIQGMDTLAKLSDRMMKLSAIEQLAKVGRLNYFDTLQVALANGWGSLEVPRILPLYGIHNEYKIPAGDLLVDTINYSSDFARMAVYGELMAKFDKPRAINLLEVRFRNEQGFSKSCIYDALCRIESDRCPEWAKEAIQSELEWGYRSEYFPNYEIIAEYGSPSTKFLVPSFIKFAVDWLNIEQSVFAVGQIRMFFLNPFIPLVPSPNTPLLMQVDSLIDIKDTVIGYNWLGDQPFITSLDSNLTSARSYIVAGDSNNCARQIKLFQQKIDEEYRDSLDGDTKFVTVEGWKFLYYNAQYILDRLPVPPPQYNLNINIIGNGAVIKLPELALYDSATTVTVTANPSTGYRFGSWSGDTVGTVNPISVVINSEKNITATFLQNTFIITATAGTNGTITPPGDVSVTYGANQLFAITPNTGYHVTDVIVDQSSVGAVASYTFTNVTAPHTISSTFAINTYTLTVNAINGTVSKSPDQPTYTHGTNVQITATPNTGYSFASWSGDFVGSANPTTIIMDANKTIIANFALNPPTITSFTPANGPIGTSVTITGTNFISVTSVKFNGTIATYTVNSSTQITATVPTGATTGTITVTNTAGTATSSTAFKVGYILTIQIAGSGTVLKNPNYASYIPGTTVTLTAKPTLIEALKIVPNTPEPISWKFDHWEIDLTGTQNPKNIIMNGNKTVKAVFVPVY